jgi:hypothetical protein
MIKILHTSAVLFAFALCLNIQAQPAMRQPHIWQYFIEDGDTVFISNIDELTVVAKPKFKNKRDWKNYSRMVYNLPRVYPYAQVAKNKLAEMDIQFSKINNKRKRKEYIKTVEKEMTEQYKSTLKKLTFSQGKMLIKLINRETETTVYQILKEMKGGFSAFFWQGVASIFGASLKSKYDKNGDDAVLESLINIYEHGDYDSLYRKVFGMGIEEHTKEIQKKRKKK